MRKPNAFRPAKIPPHETPLHETPLHETPLFEASASRSPPQTDPRPPHNAGWELRRFPNASRFIRRYDSTEFFTIRMISCKLYCLYFIFAGKDIRFL